MGIRYADAIDYIHTLFRFGMNPGLERTEELLRRLGRPDRAGARTIHVGGTNGKGSACALIAAGLQAAGYRTGLYISPFLERWNERIQIDGAPISDADVASLVTQVQPHVTAMVAAGWEQPTEFEVTTAMAFLHFARCQADWIVLEVGLGGRHDATNVIEQPTLTCITNISLDHTSVLGSTPEQIAWDKAGICKPGVPCVTATDHPGALAVIRAVAGQVGAPVVMVRPPSASTPVDLMAQLFDLTGSWRDVAKANGPQTADSDPGLGPVPGQHQGLSLGLLGRHQLRNAAVAAAALELAGVPERALRAGLAVARWPARFEVVRTGYGPDDPLLVLDGAHNQAGAAALAESWRDLMGDRRTILVTGLLADKNVDAVLSELLPLADAVVCTQPPSSRALSAERLADRVLAAAGAETLLVHAGDRSRTRTSATSATSATGATSATRTQRPLLIEADWSAALARSLDLARAGDAILVTGSLYLVGPSRSWIRAHMA